MIDVQILVDDLVLTGRQTFFHKLYFDTYLKNILKENKSKIVDEIRFESYDNTKFWLPLRLLKKQNSNDVYIESGEIQLSL